MIAKKSQANNPPIPFVVSIELHADGRPILRGVITSSQWVTDREPGREVLDGLIQVPCPYCRDRGGRPVRHIHGWEARHGFGVLSHRVAHCGPGSQMKGGYYIALDAAAKHAIEPGKPRYRASTKRRSRFGGASQ